MPRAWLVPAPEGGTFTPPAYGQDLADALVPSFTLDCMRPSAGDVDADGRDEVVLLFGGAVCGDATTTWLAVGREVEGELDFTVSEVGLPSGGAATTLADLDGDGAADLVVALRGGVSVFWGGADGLASLAASVSHRDDGAVIDLVRVARSPGASGPWRASFLTEGGTVSVIAFDGALSVDDVPAATGDHLRSADVDGDGLGDLILTGPDAIEVWLADPAPPLGDPPRLPFIASEG